MDDHNVAIGFYPQGGDDPAPTAPTRTVTEERWGWWDTATQRVGLDVDAEDEEEARELAASNEIPVRVTLTYEVPQ